VSAVAKKTNTGMLGEEYHQANVQMWVYLEDLSVMSLLRKVYKLVARRIAVFTRQYYFEDYKRVYPDAVVRDFLRRVRRRHEDRRNFLNHRKFYKFASQFANGARVVDVGCGSGYGCEILAQTGAVSVSGMDVSKNAIRYAVSKFGHCADFSVQRITDMGAYADESFDVCICSEVLEHVKEYGVEQLALEEMRRITRGGGLIVLATPNSELLGEHGFYFDELNALLRKNFVEFCLFENALVPFGERRALYHKRLRDGKTGIVVSQQIDLSETMLPEGEHAELKQGAKPGRFKFADFDVDTTLLHNTHSWIVLALNTKLLPADVKSDA
jgi:2-polyprenyl-3-methyl-5-hydroxy-6-metoxy-1,4-benzoquinol methylase